LSIIFSDLACSSSQYVKTGDAFGEKANDMKVVRITGDVLDDLPGK